MNMFDINKIRQDFPILAQQIHGQTLVYLDNAATSQKPQCVIDQLVNYYTTMNSNIHRGVHALSERATHAYEQTRDKVRDFIHAANRCEIIFVRGTTEGINLVAQSYARPLLKTGDEILITELEHHSNIVPWQLVCEQTGAQLKVAPINEQGEVILADYEALLSRKTKLVAISHISNALGTINPIKQMIAAAHNVGAIALIDGAQAAPHTMIDVQALDADFYIFSSHKLYGPTGVGVVYGKQALLNAMPPYQGGGDMIRQVTFSKTTFNDLPYKFEAGTPNIADVIAFSDALDYVNQIGLTNIANYEHELLGYATEQALTIPGLRLIGTATEKASILSFVLERIHPHDIGTILDQSGIAIRTGHHCAMPVMQHFKVPATARASFAFYNTKTEIDALIAGLHKVIELFR